MTSLLRPINLFIAACVLALVVLLVVFLQSKKPLPGAPTQFIIARDSQWYDVELHGKEREFLAFTDELLTKIAREEKLSFRFADRSSGELLSSVSRGTVEGAIVTNPPSERPGHRSLLWSDTIYQLGPVLVLRMDSEIDERADMTGKVVGVKRGASLVFDITAHADVIFVTYPNIIDAFEKLVDSSIDGVIAPYVTAHIYLYSLFTDSLRIGTEPLVDQGVRLVVPRTPWGEDLIARFNTQLKTLKENGEYQKLLKRWNLPSIEEDIKLLRESGLDVVAPQE